MKTELLVCPNCYADNQDCFEPVTVNKKRCIECTACGTLFNREA